jgi:hypothetical protein
MSLFSAISFNSSYLFLRAIIAASCELVAVLGCYDKILDKPTLGDEERSCVTPCL